MRSPQDVPQKDIQEIIAALMLPGPFAASGKQGWTVRELSAVCPSVQEPHRASQILWMLGRRRITKYIGQGQNARHYLPSEGEAVLKSATKEHWYPDRETLDSISRNRQAIRANLIAEAAFDHDQIRARIWEVWQAHPGVPLSKKDLLNAIRERYPNCPEHPVSQQLYNLVRMGKLRQNHGKRTTFIPVMAEDLVSLMDRPAPTKTDGKSCGKPHDDMSGKPARAVTEETFLGEHPAITGLLPKVEVFLLENPEDRDALPSRQAIHATVVVDADGRIRQVYLEPPLFCAVQPLAHDR